MPIRDKKIETMPREELNKLQGERLVAHLPVVPISDQGTASLECLKSF